MRVIRQNAILKLINEKSIQTQEELSRELKEIGFNVTQATVSRDIKELRLVKILGEDGIVKYHNGKNTESSDVGDRLKSILKHSLVSVDSAENDVVIKTLPGVAQAAAAAVDAMHWQEVVGTIAGDDTILIITRNSKGATLVVDKFRNFK
ncbi:MAG: arginine repressor [Bacillota bacterium]|nr:arginine repressor [Bacillota bacterium]